MNTHEHLLTCLSEECAEVAQRVSKALRFGLDEVQPEQPFNNRERIEEELRDLFAVAEVLAAEGIIGRIVLTDLEIQNKYRKIARFMAISREQGALSV